MTIPTELARVERVRRAQPETTIAQRKTVLQSATEALSRRGLAAAKAELANAALEKVLVLAYEVDTDGKLANVDPLTGRVLFPLPWGRLGGAAWGLRNSERLVMRRIMHRRAAAGGPFVYDPAARCWLLNLAQYKFTGRAMLWLQEHPITADEWRETAAEVGTAWAKNARRVAGA